MRLEQGYIQNAVIIDAMANIDSSAVAGPPENIEPATGQ